MSIHSRATSADSAPPIVSTNLGYTFAGSGLDGYLTAPFQGFDPAVTGQLTLGIGFSAYLLPSVIASLSPLQHVLAASSVADPTSLVDLAFSTPGQSLGFAAEAPSATDIAISGSTAGLSGILGPLTQSLAGTTLGSELAPVVSFAKGLLPTLDKHDGRPQGGSGAAKPFLALQLGAGVSQSVMVLGHTTSTSQSGSLTVDGKSSAAAVHTLNDTAGLLGTAGTLLSDAEAGNFPGAIAAGISTLSAATSVAGDIGQLIASAGTGSPTLPPLASAPAVDLNLQTGAEQEFSLGLGSPVSVAETLGVHIEADTFGAYALGRVLAQVVPQVIADLNDQNTVRQPLDVLSQLVGDVSTLAKDAAGGFSGKSAGGTPSSGQKPDISIQISLGATESHDTALGSVSNTQDFSATLETNAQGFYDLATAAQPALTDLLVGLLETQAGHEVLQIGGAILGQLDQKLGTSSAKPDHPIGSMHAMALPTSWHG